MDKTLKILQDLYLEYSGDQPHSIIPVGHSGSERKYFRIRGTKSSIIGVYNHNIQENRAYFYLTNHFIGKSLPVPDLLLIGKNEKVYLIEDLGDTCLFNLIERSTFSDKSSDELVSIFKDVIEFLPKFQIIGADSLDFKKCYPVDSFDKFSIMWDLNYFKYCFLKIQNIHFNEISL